MINIKAEKGFSLVEIIVAMALLLLIIIAFTTLFTFAFGGIFSQGRKSEALYEVVQNELEVLYEQGNTGGPDILPISFDGGAIAPIEVDGLIETKEYTYEDQSGTRSRTIYTFIPDDQ